MTTSPCTVGLTGGLASGKSTVAEVLARFVRVPDGTVFIDPEFVNITIYYALCYCPECFHYLLLGFWKFIVDEVNCGFLWIRCFIFF